MQKLISKLVSIVVISSLSASVAFADDEHHVKVTVDCPDISVKTKDIITNYGAYLAGEGTQRVDNDAPSHPLFEGPRALEGNIPINIKASGYDNNGVDYNSLNGSVTCYYKSRMGFDPFSISYLMRNVLGGIVTEAGPVRIRILLPIGLTIF